MTEISFDSDLLERFEAGLDPAHPERSAIPAVVLGYGEISTVLVTSVKRPDRPEGTLEVLAVDGDSAWIVQTPQLPITLSGTGDTVMSLFIGNLGNTGSVATALENAVSGVYGVLEETLAAGEHELRLVEAQDRFAHPRREFTARQVK